MQSAYYAAQAGEFLAQSSEAILGLLTRAHHHALEHEQRHAWLAEIEILQRELRWLHYGHVFLEFSIPRMGKRADCVLVVGSLVFVLEFKVGAKQFDRGAIEQVEDYALDLKNFHLGSHQLPIVPVLVATAVRAVPEEDLRWADDRVAEPILASADGIGDLIELALKAVPGEAIDVKAWLASGYRPTPTIIEAARALYEAHDVQEIARSDAGAQNLLATAQCIGGVIEQSKRAGKKAICFVTGVPGSGKTLAGLNIATKRAEGHADEHAVFLSGNGPLVDVLREALARDQVQRTGIRKGDALRRVRSFIQNIHHFRDHYLTDVAAPHEKVVVFDEAQRAWTREQASKFMQTKRGQVGFEQSEPEFLISVMDRHPAWCTVICLVGGGQEINTGEAGLQEWLTALRDRFAHWDVYASARLDDPDYPASSEVIDLLRAPDVVMRDALHLAVSMRSFRAERLSAFIGHIVENRPEAAYSLVADLARRYPIWVTRDLAEAKAWLRRVARGSERYGLVASSGAYRLRPNGLHVKSNISAPDWFLNDREDVRSSYALEEVATEFDIQGLELDWVGVCWDADYRYHHGQWQAHAFKGTKWQVVRSELRQLYLKNAYRVLLTRARQGMVIFVPEGDGRDMTRQPAFYDGTYAFILQCGIPDVPPRLRRAIRRQAEADSF